MRAVIIGVATSGIPAKSRYNGPGQPQNNWASHERTGRVAARDSHQFLEPLSRYRLSGFRLNAFRLSIEWTRVQPLSLTGKTSSIPTPSTPTRTASTACRLAGIEPVVTLQHFTHPAWLSGVAWLNDSTPELFERFVNHPPHQ